MSFSEITYREASPLERAMIEAAGEDLFGLNADLISEVWDPDRVGDRNLAFLAWSHRVGLWRPEWNEAKRRRVVKTEFERKRLVGTEAGIRAYLDLVDAELVQVVAPPQGFYASRDLTREEWQAFLDRMPQIRIYLGSERGQDWGQFFAGESFIGDAFATYNDGEALFGRKARIRYPDGREEAVRISSTTVRETVGTMVKAERLHVPGVSSDGFFAVFSFVGEGFVEAEEVEPQISTIRIDQEYISRETGVHIDTVWPSLAPMKTRVERESVVGDGGPFFFVGDAVGNYFAAGEDPAPWQIFDLTYLHDPEVAAPVVMGMSFVGHSRVSMEPFTAELLVRAESKFDEAGWIIGESFLNEGFAVIDRIRDRLDPALDAIVAGSSLRDQLGVSFRTVRERTLDDGIPLDGNWNFGELIAAHL